MQHIQTHDQKIHTIVSKHRKESQGALQMKAKSFCTASDMRIYQESLPYPFRRVRFTDEADCI